MSTPKEQEALIKNLSLDKPQYNNVSKSSRVFISYSHDSPKHKECVLKLSNLLRSEGIDCNIDQYETSPSEGWFRWMVNQIEEADFILIVCTENYEKRFKGKDEAGKGLGAKWEGAVITRELYYSEANNKCIPIVFSPEDSNYIPSILKSATYYELNKEEINDENYDELYARFTGQKTVIKPDLGELRHITPRNISPSVNIQNKEVPLVENSQKPAIGELRKITAGHQNFEIPKTFTSLYTGIEFVLIPAGDFMMGSEEFDDEKPIHKVIIKDPFYMGKYPVTQNQWKKVMGYNPSYFKGEDRPVECFSWYYVQEFIKKLNEKEGTDKYRLPSEAEWEYACRAGTTTRFYFGDDESKLNEYAWYYESTSSKKTCSIGKKKPNSWGLYDMNGNIWEWCQDNYHDNYVNAPSDGSTWEDSSSSSRVRRGGSLSSSAMFCRSANRDCSDPYIWGDNLGFRILRTL